MITDEATTNVVSHQRSPRSSASSSSRTCPWTGRWISSALPAGHSTAGTTVPRRRARGIGGSANGAEPGVEPHRVRGGRIRSSR